MAIESENEGPGGRALVLVALLALVTTGTVAFARVFRQDGTTLHLVLAGAAALLLATLFERRHVLLAAAVSLMGLALTISWLAYPNSAWYGLPTVSTWRAAVRSLAAVSRTAEVHAAPAPTLIPLLLAALAAVWAASFAAHALAVRARSPFLSILPPASLMAFAGIVMRDGSRPVYVLPFLAACLLVMFADALYRVGQWGPLTIWNQAGVRSTWQAGSWTRSARRVAMACLGVALFAPWILPGFGADSVLDVRDAVGGATVSIDPIVDIKPQLLEQSGRELFTVRSREPSYWRMIALDRFNGNQWLASDLLAENGIQTTGGDLRVQGFDRALASEAVPQRVRFVAGVQSWLPASYPAVSIDVEGEVLRQDPETGTIVLPDGTYEGFTYLATSARLVPTDRELDAIPSLADASSVLTDLPRDTPPEIYRLAQQFAAEAGPGASPFRQLMAIQRHLQSFTYSVNVPPGHGVNDILYFLQQSQQGYCEQFAGTMAVLARALGYPARVAVGFTPGTRDEDDPRLYHVTGLNAHAWVEVLFPRWGWLAFEPTPTRVNPVAQPYLSPRVDTGLSGVAGGARLLQGKRAQLERQEAAFQRGCDSGGLCSNSTRSLRDPALDPGAEPGGPSRLGTAIAAIAVALLLVLLAIPVWKVVGRRLAMARARDARQRVLAAYTVLTDQAGDVGLRRRGGETLGEYRRRLEAAVRFSDGYLGRLTGLAAAAAYSDREVLPEHAREAAECAREAGADIRRSSGRAKVALGWFRLDNPWGRE
jgi:transglutaminase-like putative cysteine protease